MNAMPMPAGHETGFDTVEIENTSPPHDADDFAQAVILAICEASVTPRVGRQTYERCMRALSSGSTARLGFRHPGKADAIDLIWRERVRYYRDFCASADKLRFLSSLPWIGPVTSRPLAWRLGIAPGTAVPSHLAVA
jgi:hypothetical protein